MWEKLAVRGVSRNPLKPPLLGHVPCSTLPQKDYNIDLRDTLEESKDMCWTCLARFYLYPYS